MFTFTRVTLAQGGKHTALAPLTQINLLQDREQEAQAPGRQQFSPTQEFLDFSSQGASTNPKVRVRTAERSPFADLQAPARKRVSYNQSPVPPVQNDLGDASWWGDITQEDDINPFMTSAGATSLFQISTPGEPDHIPTNPLKLSSTQHYMMDSTDMSADLQTLSQSFERHHVTPNKKSKSGKEPNPILNLDASRSILNDGALRKLQHLYRKKQTIDLSGETTEMTQQSAFNSNPIEVNPI